MLRLALRDLAESDVVFRGAARLEAACIDRDAHRSGHPCEVIVVEGFEAGAPLHLKLVGEQPGVVGVTRSAVAARIADHMGGECAARVDALRMRLHGEAGELRRALREARERTFVKVAPHA